MIETTNIHIEPIKIGMMELEIKGTSPYMPEPMDMDVLEMYDKKKSKQIHKKDDVSEDDKAKKKYYFTEDGKKGIPARQFYNAMVRASSYLIDKKDGGMRVVREGVTILGEILPLKYDKEERLTHWGRSSGMTGAPRKIVRNAFYNWKCKLQVKYNEAQLSPEQICNILNWAGFHIGVGAFRKENSGNYGLFEVVYKDTH
jgi:hypothetical protein